MAHDPKKRAFLVANGLDPDAYDFDENTGDVTPVKPVGIAESVGRGAVSGTGGLLGSLGGAEVGAAAPGLLAGVLAGGEAGGELGALGGPVPALIGGLVGALGGGYAGHKLQHTAVSELAPEYSARDVEAQQQNPHAFTAGSLLPQLGALRFEPGKNLEALGTLTHLNPAGLNPQTISRIANVGVGVGTQIPGLYSEYRQTGHVDPLNAAMQLTAALGAGSGRWHPAESVVTSPNLVEARQSDIANTLGQFDSYRQRTETVKALKLLFRDPNTQPDQLAKAQALINQLGLKSTELGELPADVTSADKHPDTATIDKLVAKMASGKELTDPEKTKLTDAFNRTGYLPPDLGGVEMPVEDRQAEHVRNAELAARMAPLTEKQQNEVEAAVNQSTEEQPPVNERQRNIEITTGVRKTPFDPQTGRILEPQAEEAFKTTAKERGQPEAETVGNERVGKSYEEMFAKLLDKAQETPLSTGEQRLSLTTQQPARLLTQPELDEAMKVANARGLRVELEPLAAGQRGVWATKPDGTRVVRLGIWGAGRDTPYHEMVHDEASRGRNVKTTAAAEKAIPLSAETAERYKAASITPTSDEGLATDLGLNWSKVPEGFKRWWLATKANFKAQVGRDLTPDEARAWMKSAVEHGFSESMVNPKVEGSTNAINQKQDEGVTEQEHRGTGESRASIETGGGDQLRGQAEGRGEEQLSLFDPHKSVVAHIEAETDKDFAAKIREALRRLPEERGKRAGLFAAMNRANRADRQAVYDALLHENRMDRLGEVVNMRGDLTPKQQELYDVMRREYKAAGDEARAAGQLVSGRERGSNPQGFYNVVSDDVLRTLNEKPANDPERQKLENDWLNHYESLGYSPEEAKDAFNEFLEHGKGSITSSAVFGPLRTAEGQGLPQSWIEPDALKAANKYYNRWARGRVYHDVLGQDSGTMAKLGEKQLTNGEEVDAETLRNTPRYVGNPNVGVAMRNFLGRGVKEGEGLVSSAARLTSAGVVGPLSKLTDVIGTPFGYLKLLAPNEYGSVLKGFSPDNFRKAIDDSFATGLNRHGDSIVAKQVLGMGDAVQNNLTRGAEWITKYTGAEAGEKLARVLSQSIGTNVAAVKRASAESGSEKAIKFLDSIDPNWRGKSDEMVGARIARIVQGNYDATQLPAWALEGSIAPFVGLMRWNIEQSNHFVDWVVKPAMEGNFMPAVGMALASLGGGLVNDKLRHALSPQKGDDVRWEELDKMRDQPGFEKELADKLVGYVGALGTMGMWGEYLKVIADKMTDRGNGQAYRSPLLEGFESAIEHIGASVDAIRKGEDVGRVLPRAALDFAKSMGSAFRLVLDNAGEQGLLGEDYKARLEKGNRTRDLREYNRLVGYQIPEEERGGPDYTRLGNAEFDRTEDINHAMELLPSLVQRALDTSKDPFELRQKLRAIAQISEQTTPNPDENPAKFAGFAGFTGQPAATIGDYYRRHFLNQLKGQMVPRF